MAPRPAKPRKVISATEMTKEDLGLLHAPRAKPIISRIRDSHHYLASLFAYGLDTREVAERVGYSYERVRRIRGTPSFDRLVEDLRPTVLGKRIDDLDVFSHTSSRNMLRAELMLADRLADAEETGELVPIRELVAITSDRADRFGYPKKSVNANVNIDWIGRMERAVRRSGKVINMPGASLASVPNGDLSKAAPPPLPPAELSPGGGGAESSAVPAPGQGQAFSAERRRRV